jgi:mRNA interferase YafQ
MRKPILGSRFKKEVARMERRGKNASKLREIIRLLLEETPLPTHYKDHALSGKWQRFRDCHIEPDWLLLYKIEGEYLHLVRTGTHADLFG